MKKQIRFGSLVLSIPYSSWWSIVLSALLIVPISVTSLNGGRVQADRRDCIQVEDAFTNRSYYDVVTGNKLLTPFVSADYTSISVSPDAHYVAYIGLSLFLKSVGASNHTARLLQNDVDAQGYYDARDMQWSPDEHFIAYRWVSEDGTQYVAVSDTAGNQVARHVLDHVPEGATVSLHGWSADGRYLAVSYHIDSQSPDDPTPLTSIHILSAPNLQPVETPLLTSNMVPRDKGGDAFNPYEMVQWGASGDWLDYLTGKPDEHDTLTLYSPSTGQMLTADTSGLTDPGFQPQVLWSPDGKHIAVLSPKADVRQKQFSIKWGVDIFGIDGSIFYSVSDNAIPSTLYPTPWNINQFIWSADSRSLIYPEALAFFDRVHSDLVAFNLDRKQVVPLRANVYLNLYVTTDHHYVVALWADGTNRKIDIIDTTTLLHITTLDSLYHATDGQFYEQAFGKYAPQSGWLIINEDGVDIWAVNVRTGVQRPLLSAFPTYVEQDRHKAASFTGDNRFVGGLETYSPDQTNSNYRVLSLDDGIFHNFHLPPTIVDPILIDYSSDGEVTLSSSDATTNHTLISILRSDSSIRRQFTVEANYTSIQRTNCARS